ncbi:MAG TPA: hypothetical protein VF105_03815 [Gemmatimonadaceae bacterium]
MTSTTPAVRPTTSMLDTATTPPQRRQIRERFIYRVLDRTIGTIEILFGIGTLVGLSIGAMAGDSDFRILEALLGIPVMLLTVVAGVLLYRGSRVGIALSLGLQLFQVLPVIISHTAVRYVAGLQWTLRFGGPRIWKPWGFEGSFIVLHDPAFPSLMISVNVVALVTALYLVSRLHEASQNSTVNPAEQLS